MSDAPTSAEPVKKRGRPRKVLVEGREEGSPVGGKGVVGKMGAERVVAGVKSKKKEIVEEEEVVVVKKAKKTTAKSAGAGVKAAKVTGTKSKVEKVVTTAKPSLKEVSAAKAKATATTTATQSPAASSSPILEEVFATGTMKRPAECVQPPSATAVKTTATVTPAPTAKSVPASRPAPIKPQTSIPKSAPSVARTTSAPTATHTANIAKPTTAYHPTSTQPTKPTTTPTTPPTPSTPTPAPAPSASSGPTPSSAIPTPRITTIPLPPLRTAKPASSRPPPKPPTREEVAQEAVEQVIRTGKLPDKYKPASRRITAIIVGIPFILVYGWHFWDKWKQEMHDRYPDRFPAPKKKEQPVVKVVSY